MPTRKSPRKGSLQFWPRKRAARFLPSVNWDAIIVPKDTKGLKGFIGYKAGMKSAYVKDNTPDSMTKDKRIAMPVTIIECPPVKIFSIRFYKDSKVAKDVLAEGLEKELKKKVKLPKIQPEKKALDSMKAEDYDDIRVIIYSQVKKTNVKKTPDLIEIGLNGSTEEKLGWVKENIGKEIPISQIFKEGGLVDLRGLTTGKGLQGPVRRFGIGLKAAKSEKGRRRPGSIGPWHPARVTFRVPMAGQLGMFTRVVYNNKIINMGGGDSSSDLKLKNIKNYGDIKADFIIVRGSVQGPSKRQLIITHTLRPTKKQSKKSFELVDIR